MKNKIINGLLMLPLSTLVLLVFITLLIEAPAEFLILIGFVVVGTMFLFGFDRWFK